MIKSDISDFMFKYFTNNDLVEYFWNLRENRINDFLLPMSQAGHIIYEISRYEVPNRPREEIKIFAQITPAGLSYYKSNFYKFNWSLFWTVLGVIATAIGSYFGYLAYFKSNDKGETLAPKEQPSTKTLK